MLEILSRILFFLSMLVLYANVTSTSVVIVIVLCYIVCVFSYYYFNNVRGAIDECFNYCNFNATKFTDMNPCQVSGYFVNRKYNKISNNGIGPLVGKKLIGSLCSPDGGFPKENNLFDNCGASILKPDFKNGELPSPVLKNNSNLSLRSNKMSRDKLKITFNPKEIARKNGQLYNSLNSSRRYNANLDLETYMNVKSPGFTSRVVDKAAESASYHLKYPAVRQVSSYRFDTSTLRQISRIPRINSSTSTAAVRIAPPEAISAKLLPNENTIDEDSNEDARNGNILQVLKDMSRKRNYSQEETDRSGSTPKKSRKNEMKNDTVTTSQYKRAHEDSPNDNLEEKSRKKRCDDMDRDIVKMMSYTSGLSVQGFTWDNQSKKRKSSKLEKSKNESSEKLEKFRKISGECMEERMAVQTESPVVENEVTAITQTSADDSEMPQVRFDIHPKSVDEIDSGKQAVPFVDEDEDCIRVASGKILNRTNCTYRRKLNSQKINPVAIISTEPEYVSETVYVDDKDMKENLLNNLVNDVEKKGEKNDSVVFYQNSIFEEMANKVVVEVEVHQPETTVQTASTIKAPAPISTKPTIQFNTSVTTTSAESIVVPKLPVQTATTLPNESPKSNPLLEKSPIGFTFGCKPVDVINSAKTVDKVSDKVTQSTSSSTPITSVTFKSPTTSIAFKSDAANAPTPTSSTTIPTFSFSTTAQQQSSFANPLLGPSQPSTTTATTQSSASSPQPTDNSTPITSVPFTLQTASNIATNGFKIDTPNALKPTSSTVSLSSSFSGAAQSSPWTNSSFSFGQPSTTTATTQSSANLTQPTSNNTPITSVAFTPPTTNNSIAANMFKTDTADISKPTSSDTVPSFSFSGAAQSSPWTNPSFSFGQPSTTTATTQLSSGLTQSESNSTPITRSLALAPSTTSNIAVNAFKVGDADGPMPTSSTSSVTFPFSSTVQSSSWTPPLFAFGQPGSATATTQSSTSLTQSTSNSAPITTVAFTPPTTSNNIVANPFKTNGADVAMQTPINFSFSSKEQSSSWTNSSFAFGQASGATATMQSSVSLTQPSLAFTQPTTSNVAANGFKTEAQTGMSSTFPMTSSFSGTAQPSSWPNPSFNFGQASANTGTTQSSSAVFTVGTGSDLRAARRRSARPRR